jgi:hypothetical protein
VLNGDVASPEALIVNPGPDGISLREAMTAVNNAPGPHLITFDASLAGQTIVLTHAQGGFGVSRDGIAIVGIVDANGKPTITLDAGSITPILFGVLASDFTLSRLRIVHLAGSFGVWINAGVTGSLPTPNEMRNITIEGNEFSNEGLGLTTAIPITIGTDGSSTVAMLLSVLIARNSFTNFQADPSGPGGDGVHVHADGAGSLIRDVTIAGNTFSNVTFGTELATGQALSSRIENTRIDSNIFTGNNQPVNLNHFGPLGGPASSENTIDGTQITNNVLDGSLGAAAIILIGGAMNASQDAITNTRIVNNVITGSTTAGGILVIGGNAGGAQNRVDGVSVVNNTIVGNAGNGVSAVSDPEQIHAGNTVSGVTVLNSLFFENGADFLDSVPVAVSYSITADPQFAGSNGNFFANPLFVDPVHADFHLQAGSPAIDAGTVVGAPCVDFDGFARLTDGKVDIGAYEFGAVFSPRSCTTAVAPPRVVRVTGRN